MVSGLSISMLIVLGDLSVMFAVKTGAEFQKIQASTPPLSLAHKTQHVTRGGGQQQARERKGSGCGIGGGIVLTDTGANNQPRGMVVYYDGGSLSDAVVIIKAKYLTTGQAPITNQVVSPGTSGQCGANPVVGEWQTYVCSFTGGRMHIYFKGGTGTRVVVAAINVLTRSQWAAANENPFTIGDQGWLPAGVSSLTVTSYGQMHNIAASAVQATETECSDAATTTTTQASASPSAVGDPHLTNLRGEKFDIHDGMHRLVHFPRGVAEDEALLMVDVQAVDMGHESDCYSVYLQSVKFFGKWIGEEVIVGADVRNSSAPNLSPNAFAISFADMRMDWPTLAKRDDVALALKGSMPVTVTTGMRKASGQDALGGEEITFKIGDEHPVFVQVWSSRGKNQLTHDKEVRYLNVEVQNLPKNSGGIIGLDSYSRPSASRCDLIQEERDLANYIETDSASMSLLRLSRPRWTASASSQ